MPAITDDQIDGLLCEAERRLQGQAPAAYPSSTAAHMNALEVVASSKPAAAPSEKLAIRTASSTLPTDATQTQDTAGSNWFNIPQTKLTEEFKRDWQLLRMRGMLDPKHQKKTMRSSAPKYSQVGEIIAGPTEFFSARLTRKERKTTLLGEVMASQDREKLQSKYAALHQSKAKGKKAFYQRLVSQRRRNRP